MARTNATDVKELLGELVTDDITDAIIEHIIADASILVTAKLESTGLSDATLESIEKWLSAHMAASSVCRQAKEEMVGGVTSIKYVGEWGKNLESTTFGQMVMVLDTTGNLSNLGRRPARFRAVPTIYDSTTT